MIVQHMNFCVRPHRLTSLQSTSLISTHASVKVLSLICATWFIKATAYMVLNLSIQNCRIVLGHRLITFLGLINGLVHLNHAFKVEHLFIYNIWLISGIYYLSRTQEEEALQKLYTLHNNETSAYPNTSEEEEDAPLKSAADVLFTERMKIKFNEWRNSIVSNQRVDDHRSENFKFADQFQTVFFKMRPAIMLNGFTSHQLKLIRQVLFDFFITLEYRDSWTFDL
jgi:hypothetical protein